MANYILENLNFIADILVVEMGAYRKGEIKEICEIVKPDVAVITSISNQHLALFGSVENILRTKYEIVENSQKGAVIVLNADSDMILRIAGRSGKKEVLYSTGKSVDLWASDIKSKDEKLVFNLHYGQIVKRIEARMIGEYNVGNILAAIAVSLQFGMNLNEIAEAIKEGTKRKKIGRISFKRSKYGYLVIDDSYNSNFHGFQAALKVLDNVKGGKKVLVTIGIIELGEKVYEAYLKLSKIIVKVCDVLITTDKKLVDIVQEQEGNISIFYNEDITKFLPFLKNKLKGNDIVLFEGPNRRLIDEIVK